MWKIMILIKDMINTIKKTIKISYEKKEKNSLFRPKQH